MERILRLSAIGFAIGVWLLAASPAIAGNLALSFEEDLAVRNAELPSEKRGHQTAELHPEGVWDGPSGGNNAGESGELAIVSSGIGRAGRTVGETTAPGANSATATGTSPSRLSFSELQANSGSGNPRPSGHSTIAFWGYWHYLDNSFPQRQQPAANVKVEIRDEGNWGTLGSGRTNEAGYYEIWIDRPSGGVNSWVFSENEAVQVRNPANQGTYAGISLPLYPPFDTDDDGWQRMPDGLVSDAHAGGAILGAGAIWGVFHYFRYVLNWLHPTEIAELPHDELDTPGYRGNFLCLGNLIFMPTAFMWSPGAWVHEYGHGIQYRAFGCRWPNSQHIEDPHYYYSEYDGGKAISEGWAEFVAFYFVYGLVHEDAEQNGALHHEDGWPPYGGGYFGDPYIFDGNDVEGAVMGILTDIADVRGVGGVGAESVARLDRNADDLITAADLPHEWLGTDAVSGMLPELWSVIRYDNPDSMLEFWHHWFATNDRTPMSFGNEHDLKVIFYDHGIRDLNGDGLSDNEPPLALDLRITSPPSPNGLYHESVTFRVEVWDVDPEDQPFLDVAFAYVPLDQYDGNCDSPLFEVFDTKPRAGLGEVSVSWNTASVPDDAYVVCARVDDDMQRSYSLPVRLITDNTPPAPPVLTELHTGDVWSNHNHPFFSWTNPGDLWGIARFEWQLDDDPIESGLVTTRHLVVADGVHRFRVRAVDNTENVGYWSDMTTVRVDTQPPSISLFSPDDGAQLTDNSPLFEWQGFDQDGLSGVDYYVLELHAVPACGSSTPSTVATTQTSFQPSPLDDGTYWWRVTVHDAATNLATSECRSYTNLPPNSVVLESITVKDHCSCELGWSQNTDPDFVRYDVQQRTEAGGWETIASIPVRTTLTFSPTRLIASTTYYFRTLVVDNLDVQVPSNEASVTTSPVVYPPTPVASFPKVGSHGVQVEWTVHPSDCDFLKYTIHLAETPGFTPSDANKVAEISARLTDQRDVTGLSPGTTYYFIVRVWAITPGIYTDSEEGSVTTTSADGTLRGHVWDVGGNAPLANAIVHVRLGELEWSAATDANGYYEISGLPTMTGLEVWVTHAYCGFPEPINMSITPAGTVERDFVAIACFQ